MYIVTGDGNKNKRSILFVMTSNDNARKEGEGIFFAYTSFS